MRRSETRGKGLGSQFEKPAHLPLPPHLNFILYFFSFPHFSAPPKKFSKKCAEIKMHRTGEQSSQQAAFGYRGD